MRFKQEIMTEAGSIPVSHLCGWGVWRSPTDFDHQATREIVKSSFNLWGDANDPFQIFPHLHIVGAAPYKPGQRSMLWEVGRKVIGGDPENYPQQVGDPFRAGTMVLMADGSEKQIEDLMVGDLVINHKNQPAKVTRVIKKKFTGDMVTIQVKGWHRTLTATESHHGMILPYSNEETKRIQFGEMKEGDHVLTPFGYERNENIILDLTNIVKYGLARKIQKITREYVVDEDVYCITTEGEYTAIFNGIAQFQCVSFGAKNAIEYVQFFPMANGERDVWTMVFPPYLWAMGRLYIGNNQLGTEDGSIGAWQAKAVMQYGTIANDAQLADGTTPPPYSGSVARQWGNVPGPDKDWIEVGKQHIVKSAAAVESWEDVVNALVNGYPITIASNVGFDMAQRADGFMHYSTQWGHEMCLIGVDDDASDPYAAILNSWGDVFGTIKDFKTGENWPKGTLRVRRNDVEAILAEQDSFAYSSFQGFPAQEIDKDKFDLW